MSVAAAAHKPGGASERSGTVSSRGHVIRTKFCHITGIARSGVGPGSAQQAMLSAGPDPVKPPIQPFGQKL